MSERDGEAILDIHFLEGEPVVTIDSLVSFFRQRADWLDEIGWGELTKDEPGTMLRAFADGLGLFLGEDTPHQIIESDGDEIDLG